MRWVSPRAPCRCAPTGWVGGPPPAGTEVFIGKLPQDVYENALIPLFQSVGKLYEFRLMMTFSGLNRGFAYAKYGNQRDAKEAITALHNFEVREGCAIVVCRSTEKCELSVDGLAASVSRQELEAVLRRVTEGVLSVTLHVSPCQKQAQIAVLKYSSHQAAAMAKKTLTEGNREAGVQWDAAWVAFLGVFKDRSQLQTQLRGDSSLETSLVPSPCPVGGQLSCVGLIPSSPADLVG